MKIVSKIVGLELITTTWPGFASAFFAPLLLRETISISRETWRMETWRKIDVVARLRQISIVLYFTFLFFFFITEHQALYTFDLGPFCRKRFQVSWRPRWKSRFAHPFKKYIPGSSGIVQQDRKPQDLITRDANESPSCVSVPTDYIKTPLRRNCTSRQGGGGELMINKARSEAFSKLAPLAHTFRRSARA